VILLKSWINKLIKIYWPNVEWTLQKYNVKVIGKVMKYYSTILVVRELS
jgi:hypothetical protein